MSPSDAGGSECLVLTARGAKIFAPSTGDSAALLAGDEGGLAVDSDCVLETEEMDWWRGTWRLERKPWGASTASGEETGSVAGFDFLTGVLTARKFLGKGMW